MLLHQAVSVVASCITAKERLKMAEELSQKPQQQPQHSTSDEPPVWAVYTLLFVMAVLMPLGAGLALNYFFRPLSPNPWEGLGQVTWDFYKGLVWVAVAIGAGWVYRRTILRIRRNPSYYTLQ